MPRGAFHQDPRSTNSSHETGHQLLLRSRSLYRGAWFRSHFGDVLLPTLRDEDDDTHWMDKSARSFHLPRVRASHRARYRKVGLPDGKCREPLARGYVAATIALEGEGFVETAR